MDKTTSKRKKRASTFYLHNNFNYLYHFFFFFKLSYYTYFPSFLRWWFMMAFQVLTKPKMVSKSMKIAHTLHESRSSTDHERKINEKQKRTPLDVYIKMTVLRKIKAYVAVNVMSFHRFFVLLYFVEEEDEMHTISLSIEVFLSQNNLHSFFFLFFSFVS